MSKSTIACDPKSLADQLVSACAKGSVTETKRLLEFGADPNAARSHGTPLCAATRSPNPYEIIRLLVDAKANPNQEEVPGWTPLFCAVGNNRPDLIRLLVECGANVNAQCTVNDWTALMNAASFGHIDCTLRLLALGADTTLRSVDGLTALDIAQGNGRDRVVRILGDPRGRS